MEEIDRAGVTDRITSLLTDMIAISTAYPPGHSVEMCRYIGETLTAAGYDVETLSRVDGLENVVARLGSGSPSLVFNTHIDTVGPGDLALWDHPPLEARIADGKLSGLGAVNCKGSGAVQIWLAEEIARHGGPLKGEVVFSFVTDEESIDCNGMAYLRESDALKPDMLLVAAPTNNTLIIAERGVLWLEINTVGKPAHAGEPSQGDNAISRMMRICTAIEAEMNQRLASRVSGDMRSTMNLGWFHGGENTNVVPSRCRVEIDRRLLPTETVDEAFAEIVAIVERVGEPDDMFEIRKIRGTNGFIGDQRSSFVTTMMSAIEDETGSIAAFTDAIGVSDGRYFADDGIDIVVFGPGDGNQGHAANETVEVAALSEGAFILHRAVADILGFAKDG